MLLVKQQPLLEILWHDTSQTKPGEEALVEQSAEAKVLTIS
jgi:hypothetical protein